MFNWNVSLTGLHLINDIAFNLICLWYENTKPITKRIKTNCKK